MNWFARLPIRQKLLALTMIVTTCALLLAAVEITVLRRFDARAGLLRSIEQTAEVMADNTAATLTFTDPEAAMQTMNSLNAQPDITTACLYKDRVLFATYKREGPDCPPFPTEDGARFSGGNLEFLRPVSVDDSRVGTLYIRAALDSIYAAMQRETFALMGILGVSAAFAYVLSSRLQTYLSKPLLSLAGTAQTVTERKDYSLRARRETDDELGTLVNAFNDMLSQIQSRDAELMRAKDVLEERVKERTAELQLRNEQLDRSNRDLDEFSYIASHDLKEPLRGIHNYASFLLEDYQDKLAEEGREQLQTLVRLSRMMEKIIDSLLEYARLNQTDLVVERVDLNQVLREVLESLSIMLIDAKVEVRIPKALPHVTCDRVRVAEVYRNLISNAVKYNDKPNKWIEVGGESNDGKEVLYVRDNGIGIPEKHRDAVFQIFKRLHARDKFGGGTGAGLTIVKKIIERHNGKLWLASTLGEGTTFFFTLTGESQ